MTTRAATLTYPAEGFGPPKDRHGTADGTTGLPVGTQVFSADDHISLSEDIFFEKFPDSMKDQAPRVVHQDGAWTLTVGGKHFLPREFTTVLTTYDPLVGAATNDPAARAAELESDGIHRELAFPNAMLGLMGWPDKEVRELCFRIYNEHIAELQERSPGRFYGVGICNWWDAEGCRPHAHRDARPRPAHLLDAAQAGQRRRRQADRLQRRRDARRVGRHRGERPPRVPPHRRGAPRVAVP